eukprot:SM000004S15041  [mRNA]  locus=s4:924473:926130:- [translate_table: standard]
MLAANLLLQLFQEYRYEAAARMRFGVSLSLLVDCLNVFASLATAAALELRYPGPDAQLCLNLTDESGTCTDAEIRTRVRDRIPRGYSIDAGGQGRSAISAALKEAIEDLEWPGASVQVIATPVPPTVSFRCEGAGDLQIDMHYEEQSDLFIAFQCDHKVSFRYKYKHLSATTANIPTSILKENQGSKLTIDAGGLLKVQHLVTVRATPHQQHHYASPDQGMRISYIEFYVLPEEEMDDGGSPGEA